MKKKTILYITELFPYPPTSGAKIKSLNTIQTLSKKFNIILVCFNQNNISKKDFKYIKQYTQQVKVFSLPNLNSQPQEKLNLLILNYLKLTPHFLYQFYSNSAEKYIKLIIEKINPDIIHVDHINMAQYLPVKKTQKWILEEHNVEHILALEKFVYFPKLKKTKIFLFFEYLLTYFYERRTLPKFDYIFSISNFDREIIIKKFNLNNISTQNLVYEFNKQQKCIFKNKTNKNLLFIGDITWFPNKLAIKWFTQSIFPLIRMKEPNVTLNIVGEIENSFSKELTKEKNVITHGFTKDVSTLLSKASLFIMPFQVGGGVRIKALTAFSYKLPIVTTPKGIQGIEGTNKRDYLIANNEKDFANKCISILKNFKLLQTMGENGYNYLLKNHSHKNNNTFLNKYLKITQ